MWCTDSCSITCDKEMPSLSYTSQMNLPNKQLQHKVTRFSFSCHLLMCVCLTKMSTYWLWRVCIGMICRIKRSVCSQHSVEHSVITDHTMIYKKWGDNGMKQNFFKKGFAIKRLPCLFHQHGTLKWAKGSNENAVSTKTVSQEKSLHYGFSIFRS